MTRTLRSYFTFSSDGSIPGWILLAVFLAASCTTTFLFKSFWLDECITAWVVQGTFTDVYDRAVIFQGQSPLYYWLVWLVRMAFGQSEIAFRALSVFFLGGSSVLLYRIARRFVSSSVAILSVPFFLSLAPVVRVFSARPYAAALFFSLFSLYSIMEWQKSDKKLWLSLSALAIVISFYMHYLFALFGLVPLVYVWISIPNQKKHTQILGEYFIAALLSIPGLFQMASLYGRQATLFFSTPPTLSGFIRVYLPPSITVSLIGGLLIGKILSREMKLSRPPEANIKSRLFLLGWFLIPPMIFALYSQLAGGSLFNERYFLWYSAPLAIGAAAIVSWVQPLRAQSLVMVIAIFLLAIGETERRWHLEDWRGAAQILTKESDNKPILLVSGLIESAQVSWLSDPQKIPYLSSPLTVYGVTSKIIPLPLTGQSEDARLYLNEHVLEPLLESKGGTLVYLAPLSSTLGGALDEVLYSHGLRRDHGESDELVRIEKISLANQQ